jgi:hypothetical protein
MSVPTTDNGTGVTRSHTSAITGTVPTAPGSGLPCFLIQPDTGQVTVQAGARASVTNRQSQLKLAGSGAVGTLIASAASTYDVAGEERA